MSRHFVFCFLAAYGVDSAFRFEMSTTHLPTTSAMLTSIVAFIEMNYN